MSESERPPGDANDAELISRVRGGDVDAYGQLFARHVDAATRLARTLAGGSDADDLVSEAFTKVLNVLLDGGGPDIAFRAYLLTAVRRLHVDKVRATNRATPTDDLAAYDPGVPFRDTVIAGFEGGAAARAFASLPERWQMVLWHLEVEGQKPGDIAALLGMSANSVSALAYRAREGLRQAFLQMHTADLVDDGCRWTHDKLGAYVRNGLSRRDHDKVERHLDECRRCTAIYLELAELNSSLAAVIGPLVLGGAAAAYLAGTTAGATGLVGVSALLGRARDFVTANTQATIAVGAATGLAAVATAGVLVMHRQPERQTLAASEPAISQPSVRTPAGTPRPTHRQPQQEAGHRTPMAPRSTAATTAAHTTARAVFPSTTATTLGAPATAPSPVVSGSPHSTAPSSPPPATKPAPKPAPKPPPKSPPPEPPPSQAPPPSADLSVLHSSVTPVGGRTGARLASTVTATVTGLPAGASTTVTITPTKTFQVEVRHLSSGCTAVSTSTVTCTVTAASPSMQMTYLHPGQSLVLVFRIPDTYRTPSGTASDPATGNNSCTWDPRTSTCS